MAIEKLSTEQYAERYGGSRQYLLYRINNGLDIDGVVNIERVSTRYILSVDTAECNKAAKIKKRKKAKKFVG